MKSIVTASIIAPLVVPLGLVVIGRFSSGAVGVASVSFIFTAGMTWVVGVPMNLALARAKKEKWWISVIAGFVLGDAMMISLAGRLPEKDLGYVLCLYGLCGAVTAGAFHLLWKMAGAKNGGRTSKYEKA